MIHILELIERHRSKAQKRWKKGSQLRDSGAANYDAFMHGEAVGLTKAYNNCAQWIKESLHKEDETTTKTNMEFEYCLANVDPKIRKEVSDKIDEAIQANASLQDEDETVTNCHQLEKEIDDYIGNHFSELNDGILISDASGMELAITDIAPMARHFAKWGAEHLKK